VTLATLTLTIGLAAGWYGRSLWNKLADLLEILRDER